MCNDLKSIEEKEYTGFKIVAKKNGGPNSGEYFSIATGIKYKNGKRIRPPKRQRKISSYFRSGLLHKSCSGWRDDMVGRTAVFKDACDARLLEKEIVDHVSSEFTIEVALATVSGELMEGTYGENVPVVAGKKITFVEE